MNKTIVLCLLVLCTIVSVLSAQKSSAPTQELVSLNPNIHINEAVQVLENLALRTVGKKILNLSNFNSSIGVPINNLPWEKALELILLQNGLIREDAVGFIAIKNVSVQSKEDKVEKDANAIDPNAKQVRIKAVAMLADRSYLKNLGIDWSTVMNGKVQVNAGFSGATQVTSLMNLSASGSRQIGNYTVDINTLLKTIENDQMGSIIAQPNILVTSGKQGYIQVGQDISIKTADEAGNTKDAFFATGVILDVLPTIIEVNGEELIHMKLSIERSSGVPSAVSTVISKSKSITELILYDGEETAIGGLFDTDETKARSGIPILKDLPWWVFGIRYLTGYDSYDKKERELIITIKAEIVESALQRKLQDAAAKAGQ